LRNLGKDRLLKLHRDIAAVKAETDELHPNFCSHYYEAGLATVAKDPRPPFLTHISFFFLMGVLDSV
jgi:hypothetical protein